MTPDELAELEQRLTTTLAAWGISSVAIGPLLMAAGCGGRRPALAGYGRQAVMWGAIDAAIAGIASSSRARRGPLTPDEAARKARTLQITLAINTLADLGYVGAGALVTARARRGRSLWRMGAGDGLSIITQGAFLLALDAVHLRELSRGRRAGSTADA